jgi:hypothetical protein
MHSHSLQLVFSLRRSLFLALVTVGTMIVAILCSPTESRGEFLVPSWRGASDATWYQWANPYGSETLVSSDPELYSYAPGSFGVPSPAPSGTATLVTPLTPIGSGNFYNGSFGFGPFVPDTFALFVPSFLQPGLAGTVVLQVRGSLGENDVFISTPRLTVDAGTVSATLLQQVTTGTAGGGGFDSNVVESLYAWETVVTDGGLLQIEFENANHVSLMAFSVDTSATIAPVPEPGTTAAAAAAAAMAAAGYGRRRLLRRGRKQATEASAAAAERSVEVSPSSSCSSSSRSLPCSSGCSCQQCSRCGRAPAARSA